MFGGFGGALPLRLTPEALTGWSAAQHARFCADLVACKRVAPLAVVTYTLSGGVITTHASWSMIEIGTVSAFAPELTTSGTGVVLVTFEPQFADEFDISGFFHIRHAKPTGHGSSCRKVTAELVSPNSVRVNSFNAAGTATDAKVTLRVL